MLVNIEYSLQGNRDLHDVQIVIPLGTNEPPEVVNIDGTFKHDARYFPPRKITDSYTSEQVGMIFVRRLICLLWMDGDGSREHRMIWHMDMIDQSNSEGR